jgi:hypothetical protein
MLSVPSVTPLGDIEIEPAFSNQPRQPLSASLPM